MKKQLSKKLVFSKETVSNLNAGELSAVKGGYITYSCQTGICCTTGCPSVKIVYCD